MPSSLRVTDGPAPQAGAAPKHTPAAETAATGDWPAEVLFVNDKALYNRRYRSNLMDYLADQGCSVRSAGYLDGLGAVVQTARQVAGFQQGPVVSSNLKANILTALVRRKKTVMILNGLGRWRARRRFRTVLRLLLAWRRNTRIVVQSYADFRYLRRYCPAAQAIWVPGSGGRVKPFGRANQLVLVQRDAKIAKVADDTRHLLAALRPDHPITIVGCKDTRQLDRLFGTKAYRAAGYVPADEIFAGGGVFIQPSGYGEGFPHTLADAIASGMEIMISAKEFTRYGLHRLGARRSDLCDGWYRLDYGPDVRDAISADRIADRVCRLCKE